MIDVNDVMQAPAQRTSHMRATADFVEGLRAEIIAGHRPPNSRVQLEDLRQKFNISLSPIREGLSHLVAEGFLVAVGQRGYRVAPISIEEFLDLQAMRIDLELKALRNSITLGEEKWEIDLMSAFKLLQNFEDQRWGADELASWEERHHRFHEALISACGSPLLMRFCRTLHQMSDRYRRVCLKTRDPDRDVIREHRALYEEAFARNADHACEILKKHIERTGENVLSVMRKIMKEQ